MLRFSLAALATLSVFAATPIHAQAVTYTFSESAGAVNLARGFLGDGIHASNTLPITFDFTVANALAANTQYNFGFSGIESGESGNVISIHFSNGTAASNFSSANYRGRDWLSRIGLVTDASANISLFDILVSGPSTFVVDGLGQPSAISIQVQHTDPRVPGVAMAISLSNPDAAGGIIGEVVCRAGCGGRFVGAPAGNPGSGGPAGPGAVPEPGTWAMMLVGFAGIGYSLRRRKRKLVDVYA